MEPLALLRRAQRLFFLPFFWVLIWFVFERRCLALWKKLLSKVVGCLYFTYSSSCCNKDLKTLDTPFGQLLYWTATSCGAVGSIWMWRLTGDGVIILHHQSVLLSCFWGCWYLNTLTLALDPEADTVKRVNLWWKNEFEYTPQLYFDFLLCLKPDQWLPPLKLRCAMWPICLFKPFANLMGLRLRN